jgi:hypothetical protein
LKLTDLPALGGGKFSCFNLSIMIIHSKAFPDCESGWCKPDQHSYVSISGLFPQIKTIITALPGS